MSAESAEKLFDQIPVFEVDLNQLGRAEAEHEFVRVAFELLNETLRYLHYTCGLYTWERPGGLDRDEAIVVGQLVRMLKLAHAILGKAQQDRGGDQHSAISRQFLEGLSIVKYLTKDIQDKGRFDAYVGDGLIAEKQFSSLIDGQVKNRDGEVWELEQRLQSSISHTFESAGVEKVLLPGRKKIGYASAEERLRLVGSTAYGAYRATSSGIHGTWHDLQFNHLRWENGKFHPEVRSAAVRPQIFFALSFWGTDACLTYIDAYLPSYMAALGPRLAAHLEKVRDSDAIHEKFIMGTSTQS
ncbi:DUF5677 domain-containing protein [Rhodococcus indonesiensis]|uniref:DUF5677 domain-containing protein n=1 Tax=Rhodococcus indonesiensis TaxID=3055869 RepID=UPI0039F6DF55